MLVKVIGTRKLDFMSSDNKQIKGTKVFVTYKSDNDYDNGEVADGVFIKEGSVLGKPVFELGKEYNFDYSCAGLGGRSTLTKITNKDGTPVKQETTVNARIF